MCAESPINLSDVIVDPIWALRITPQMAHRKQLLPLTEIDGKVLVATNVANNGTVVRNLEKKFGKPVQLELADAESLSKAIEDIYGSRSQVLMASAQQIEFADGNADEMVELGNRLLDAAILRQASDVHIDPDKDKFEIRLRVAGDIEPFDSLPIAQHGALLSRLKVLANLDIAEKRAPQDGSMVHRFQGTGVSVDIRVATIPTKHGEKMTLRLLGMRSDKLTLENLGMSPEHMQIFRKSIAQPHGMILVTGPTGSGKSTTFYAALREINRGLTRTIMTIEDPVEYDLAGINQVQVDEEKVTFAKALRSVLRHDPDVVMVGEIRDPETAEIAVTAAMTGHLVLSTLHTNSAASAVTRLLNMGLEPYLLSAILRLSIAQRLVRELCTKCAKPYSVTEEQAFVLGDRSLKGTTAYVPVGCKYCANRGTRGRIGLFEFLPLDDRFRSIIREGMVEDDLLAKMADCSIASLRDDGLAKALAGIVPLSEVIRVTTIV
jgi:type IV pilus assembly protein PilB